MFLEKNHCETNQEFAERLRRHQRFQLEIYSGFAPEPSPPTPPIRQTTPRSIDPYGLAPDLDDYGDF